MGRLVVTLTIVLMPSARSRRLPFDARSLPRKSVSVIWLMSPVPSFGKRGARSPLPPVRPLPPPPLVLVLVLVLVGKRAVRAPVPLVGVRLPVLLRVRCERCFALGLLPELPELLEILLLECLLLGLLLGPLDPVLFLLLVWPFREEPLAIFEGAAMKLKQMKPHFVERVCSFTENWRTHMKFSGSPSHSFPPL